MNAKYADVITLEEALGYLTGIGTGRSTAVRG
jgi:hypothetical protein